jgi:2-polyprenyl-3-methyl-5-hydroxy-6-metoxy-1,4-benzoquinol methylase
MTRPETDAQNPKDRWDNHWDRYADSTRANPGHALRRSLIFRLLGPDAAGADAAILDFGCGSGDLLGEMAGRYGQADFAGIDQSASGLDHAREKLPGARLTVFDFAAASGAPEELKEWASHVVCSEVLEHVGDPVLVLKNAALCLRPGGRLVVTVPGGPMSAFDKHLGHRRHFTKAALTEALTRAGLQVEVAAAAGFPVFNLYRMVVVARGESLIEDVSGEAGPLARLAMAVFRWLMPLTLFNTPWGWQIVARGQKPARKPG